ncbi:multidrug/hemolysin transport system permease protein [Lactobacillus colini]|uniref:Multidrug/hemolysin transport system permease protein n=1 Tax=Lactobacillus colini TaxID=1819254 RepID=A0ABS4MC65_9LACO|nr:ABC transporter permease [Lactobacillus colini]MBP2057273.1 multidrug/hemolysin transport system permease protein [Lactobacillus colini]
MFALLRRNIKVYFSNVPSVIMSCFGALISFFIYIGFLQDNLLTSWQQVPSAREMLDLWIIAGIVAVAGITTSFQTLGQLVKDNESRTSDDIRLTDVTSVKQNIAYLLSSSIVSLIMQAITLLVMVIYFKLVDKIDLPTDIYGEVLLFMVLGAIAATLVNEIIVSFIHSATTFSRLSAVIGAAAGFAVATYLPFGSLSTNAQNLVKLVPSSYEAAGLRSLLLNQLSKTKLDSNSRQKLFDYLGVQFKINGHQLSRLDNIYVMLGMIAILTLVIIVASAATDRKRSK